MNEEKKYSIIGRVEIGTDEYRDLIESVKEAERNYSDTQSRLWKEQDRANKAEKNATYSRMNVTSILHLSIPAKKSRQNINSFLRKKK